MMNTDNIIDSCITQLSNQDIDNVETIIARPADNIVIIKWANWPSREERQKVKTVVTDVHSNFRFAQINDLTGVNLDIVENGQRRQDYDPYILEV